jgi:toxin ParE1/3/4
MRLRYSPRALAEMLLIHEYIAERNKSAATAALRQIRSTSELLALYPGLGRETDIPGVRVYPVARYPYMVYHSVHEDEVVILHVRDGRRRRPKEGEL